MSSEFSSAAQDVPEAKDWKWVADDIEHIRLVRGRPLAELLAEPTEFAEAFSSWLKKYLPQAERLLRAGVG